uniref:Nose resistant to fluoxetine protein 6 n=1 Tax=Angiostrongylus cantonensis TaxID=6313 RepID=A0A0K0DQF5_ANGCA
LVLILFSYYPCRNIATSCESLRTKFSNSKTHTVLRGVLMFIVIVSHLYAMKFNAIFLFHLLKSTTSGRTPFSCCSDHGKEIYPTNCGVSFTHAPLETYSEFLHSKGCADALHDSIYRNLDIVIAICVIVGGNRKKWCNTLKK